MRAYVLKRVLLFFPTLGLILLALFGVVNAVPAVPTGAGVGSEAEPFRESYRVFREQFGLDRPVFLNFRHSLDDDEVRQLLRRAADDQVEERLRVRQDLHDLGRYAVPGLVATAGDESELDAVRDLALAFAFDAVRQRARRGDDEEARRARSAANERIAPLEPPSSMSAEDRARLASGWVTWLEEHRGRYELGFGERLRRTFLDTRFAIYCDRIAHLDFGVSMSDRQPVLATILRRFKVSGLVALLGALVAFLVGIPLGVLSARLAGTRRDRGLTLLLYAMFSVPSFFAATLLLRFFSVGEPFDWFPVGGLGESGRLLDTAHHLVLPVFCISYAMVIIMSRYVRASLLEVMRSDYVRTARAKGLPREVVFRRHALRNALLPVITFLGDVPPAVFGGSVVVEFLFDLPGVGTYLYEAALGPDYNAILASTLIMAVLTLVGYLLSDVLYAVADPRISFGGGEEEGR